MAERCQPFVVGGHSRAAARRAGRFGDGFFPLGVSAERLAVLRDVMDESARQHGRDPAAIALTLIGGADLKSAEFCARLGADRMVVAADHRNLDELRRWVEKFSNDVIRRI